MNDNTLMAIVVASFFAFLGIMAWAGRDDLTYNQYRIKEKELELEMMKLQVRDSILLDTIIIKE